MNRSISIPVEDSVVSSQNEKATWQDYYTVTKPGIIRSNVIAAVAGFLIALGTAPFTLGVVWTLVLTVLGITFVMAASTTFNNVYDRDIDAMMERTKNRAITSGRLSPKAATIYGFVLAIIGESLLFIVHPLTALLGFIGLFFYAVVYTIWLKRTTTLNTVVGAIPGSMPFLVGYVALVQQFDTIAWVLFAFMSLWQIPHFLALAMRRVEEYRNANVPMLPVVSGFNVTKRQIFWYTGGLFVASILIYLSGALGLIYIAVTLPLGIYYVYLATKGLFLKQDESQEQDMKWANKMFAYSIIYLTIMLVVMMVDSQIAL